MNNIPPTKPTTEQLLGELAKQDEAKFAEQLAKREAEALAEIEHVRIARHRMLLNAMAAQIASGMFADPSRVVTDDEVVLRAVHLAEEICALVEKRTAVRPKP